MNPNKHTHTHTYTQKKGCKHRVSLFEEIDNNMPNERKNCMDFYYCCLPGDIGYIDERSAVYRFKIQQMQKRNYLPTRDELFCVYLYSAHWEFCRLFHETCRNKNGIGCLWKLFYKNLASFIFKAHNTFAKANYMTHLYHGTWAAIKTNKLNLFTIFSTSYDKKAAKQFGEYILVFENANEAIKNGQLIGNKSYL